MKKLEIERRFLLKNLPKLREDESYLIEQFYTKNNERFRRSFKAGQGNKWVYEKIIKRNINSFTNEEEIFECTNEEYVNNYILREKIISKKRHIFKQNDFKFEIDEYLEYKLIICEIELESEDQKIIFPAAIKSEIIYELTGIKEFSNFNLAEKK